MEREKRYFEVDRKGSVIIWKYYNPPNNLICADTWEDLHELVSEFEQDIELRVAILTSALPDVFIQHYAAAAMLKMSNILRASPDEDIPESIKPRQKRPNLTQVSKPIVCAINGWVAGGGCELALDGDFRFMSVKATIGLPEVNFGILPPYGIQGLPRLLGVHKALELIMLGKIIDAKEAKHIGLVNRTFEPGELMPAALNFANELASRPQLAISHIKRCIYEGTEMPIQEGLALSMKLVMELAKSDDAYRLMEEHVAAGQNRMWILEQFGTQASKSVYHN